MISLALTVVKQTAKKLTVSWTPPAGAVAYAFYRDGQRVSNTQDGTRSSVTFGIPDGGEHTFEVVAMAGLASGAVTINDPAPTPEPPSPAPPTPSAAWPKGGYGLWIPGHDLPANAGACDVVITADWQAAKLAAIPGPTKRLVYLSAISCPPTSTAKFYGVTREQLLANGWYLKDSGGNPVVNESYSDSTLADPGQEGYRKAWIAGAEAFLDQYGLDGFEMDDVVAQLRGYTGASIPAYPTSASWEAAIVGFVNEVGAALRAKGFYCLPNVYKSGGSEQFAASMKAGADGVMLENCFQSGGVGTQDDVKALLAAGLDVVALCEAPLSGKEAQLRAVDNGRGVYCVAG